jgi:organic radical activating enzyme
MTEFPIKTATACRLKWEWSTVFLHNAWTSSCHRCENIPLTVDNISDFHNLPMKQADREVMIAGKWPGNGCEFCKKIEDVGGVSERLQKIEFPEEHVAQELLDNPLATSITPTTLEIYFSNLCNMACIYCGSHFSSVWEAEDIRAGNYYIRGKKYDKKPQAKNNNDYPILKRKLWEWIAENHQKLRKFHILGGEPLFQPEIYECLDFFETHASPELTVVIFTNLKISAVKLTDLLDRFERLVKDKKIKSLQITASIDCWGAEQEYIRSGLDLNQWRKNVDLILARPLITICFNAAVTGLGIHTLPDLLKQIHQYNKIRPTHWFFMRVFNPEFLDPCVFGNYLSGKLNKCIPLLDPIDDMGQKDYFIGLIKQVYKSKPDFDKIKQLMLYLDDIDSRRGCDWRTTFPWLWKDFGHLYE